MNATASLLGWSDGYLVIDRHDRITEVGGGFTQLLGYAPEDLPWPAPWPWWPVGAEVPGGSSRPPSGVLADARGHDGLSRTIVRMRHRSGNTVWVEVSLCPIAPDEATLVAVLRDVSDAHWDHQRLRVLAEAGRMLSGGEDLEHRLRVVAEATSRAVESGVAITATTSSGEQRPVTVTGGAASGDGWRDVARRELLEEVLDNAGDTVVTLQVLVRPEGPDAGVAPWQSALVAPLASGVAKLGTLVVFAPEGDREWAPEVRSLVEELAQRLGALIDADRLAHRERQMHGASAALAAAATVPQAAHALADALQRALGASGVAVYTRSADDQDHLHLAYVTGHDAEFAEHFGRIPMSAQCLTGEVARTGDPAWLGERDGVHQPFPLIDEIGGNEPVHAAISLPLRIGDRVTGVVTATFATTREFAAAERNFAQTLVGQAAHVLDRAATADARAEIARTLQHALLPGQLPQLPRLGLASHYQPAGQHSNAGGDWYDVIALGGSRVGLVVGDVTGSGPTAAAVMGQLRAALAGFLLEGHSCARALTLLDRLARRIDGAAASTVSLMIMDVDTGELRWAYAGHLPALLLRPPGHRPATRWLDDVRGAALTILPLDAAAAPPGAAPATTQRFEEGHVMLEPGDTVLLFTDGLVERRGEDLDSGLARLADAVAGHADQPPAALLNRALSGALDGTATADDVALVVARLRPPPLHEQLPATPVHLRQLRARLLSWAETSGLPSDGIDDLQLIVGEAAANSIEHAYPDRVEGQDDPHFHLTLEHTDSGGVSVEVRDHGRWRPEPEDRGFRGRGLEMIHILGEDVSITHDDGTVVSFVFPVPARSGTDTPEPPDSAPAGPDAAARIDVNHTGATAHVHLRGDFDIDNIEPLRAQLTELIHEHGRPVEIDLSEVTYLPSSGIRLLAEVRNSDPDRLHLRVRAGTLPQRLLDIVGLPYSRRCD